eukprot:CAMPEP_0113318186 /NCGR_PEP_ID=MMETSP0010_2-20120614/12840_1 /TAXON_ID=216773 ORGANISM="Corethron hystrix, Strain 308" /NCGR_SAMPLE_ID=MMETSP0010_2 /ASSEMBLY_ACC=CAM_ASM_000155 /LENGTH=211 /DNA_ID=CAMNT_0000175407 /DNA_START=597 /DNA_END=1231 /DNA_ORIENTATION=+ /assembly_acc=CAM_ASM_000155
MATSVAESSSRIALREAAVVELAGIVHLREVVSAYLAPEKVKHKVSKTFAGVRHRRHLALFDGVHIPLRKPDGHDMEQGPQSAGISHPVLSVRTSVAVLRVTKRNDSFVRVVSSYPELRRSVRVDQRLQALRAAGGDVDVGQNLRNEIAEAPLRRQRPVQQVHPLDEGVRALHGEGSVGDVHPGFERLDECQRRVGIRFFFFPSMLVFKHV